MGWRFVFAGPCFADGYTLGFLGSEFLVDKSSSWQRTISLSSDAVDYKGTLDLLLPLRSVTSCTTLYVNCPVLERMHSRICEAT